jgi:hypothetical protein
MNVKYGYIYCTTDLTNGIKYIGKKISNIFIPSYYGSGTIIKRIKNKRPETLRVDLIEWCYSVEELNQCEADWTDAIGLYPLSYNLKRGGIDGSILSNETKIKLSLVSKGKQKSDEHKKHISNSHIGIKYPNRKRIKFDEKHKKNIGEALIGNKSIKGQHWYNNGIINKIDYECPDGFISGMIKRVA